MATATAQPQAAPKKAENGKQAAPMLRPFFPGTLDLETHTYVKTGTLTTQQIPLDTFNPKTNGFLADLWVEFTAVAAGNSATVAFNEDYPFRAMATFTLSDTGGQPILGPMTGWELMIFVKWGGFSFSDDPRDSQTYSASRWVSCRTPTATTATRWTSRSPRSRRSTPPPRPRRPRTP